LNGAKRIVVAVPVASVEAVTKLKPKVDELICLHVPDNFMAVGQFYEDFSEVTDENVIRILRKQQPDKSKI
jgi:putative phosphoribosyl transferase